jgi:hypothetical protein
VEIDTVLMAFQKVAKGEGVHAVFGLRRGCHMRHVSFTGVAKHHVMVTWIGSMQDLYKYMPGLFLVRVPL